MIGAFVAEWRSGKNTPSGLFELLFFDPPAKTEIIVSAQLYINTFMNYICHSPVDRYMLKFVKVDKLLVHQAASELQRVNSMRHINTQ